MLKREKFRVCRGGRSQERGGPGKSLQPLQRRTGNRRSQKWGEERAVRRLPPPGRLGRESKPGGEELPSKDAASEEEKYCVSPSL